MPGTKLQIENLHKRFLKGGQDIHVLRGINLEIQAGERLAVLGPSGAGKSTFLHVIGTLERPTEGRVLLDGVDAFMGDPRDVDARRNLRIGFIFQFHHLLSDQTALWNVAMPAIIAGYGADRAQAMAIEGLSRFQLENRAIHKPGELSGGEQQRVAIARAMVMRPGLILADEPTGNLDPHTAEQVFDEFLSMHEHDGSTLIVVTHSEELALRFPRRLRLRDGLFVEERS